jgi:transposase-like protein
MECPRCQGFMYQTVVRCEYGIDKAVVWRCANCSEQFDLVTLYNRKTHKENPIAIKVDKRKLPRLNWKTHRRKGVKQWWF